MMSNQILSSVRLLRFNTFLIGILSFSLVFLTDFCSGMETDTCWANRPQTDDRCNIDVTRVPMNPSPIIPKTNYYAPVIGCPPRETGCFIRTDRAPVGINPCGSAPFKKLIGLAQYFKQSEKGAPYMAANLCPKAPSIVSNPSLRIEDYCKQ